MESKPILNWPAIWRTCIIILPIALVLHAARAVLQSYFEINIPHEGISGAVGVLGAYVLLKVIDRMDTQSSSPTTEDD